MSETLETVLRASVRTLAAAAGLSPSRMHQLGKLTVLQTITAAIRLCAMSWQFLGVDGTRSWPIPRMSHAGRPWPIRGCQRSS